MTTAMMPITTELHLQFITKCRKGTRYQRTCYYFIQSINHELTKLGVKERILRDSDWDEIYRLVNIMSSERKLTVVLRFLLEIAILKMAPNLVISLSANPQSMMIINREAKNLNVSAVLFLEYSRTHYNHESHTANNLEIECSLIINGNYTTTIRGYWRDTLRQVLACILLMKEATEDGD
jgi:hypothetical protein